MFAANAFSAGSATSPLAAPTTSRRDLGPRDLRADTLLCGVCHSDLHYARNESKDIMPTVYPRVPGHEIVGRVASVGPAVRDSGDDRLLRRAQHHADVEVIPVQKSNEA
jgi:uncharacterized zinc-type alcohol dehydrogenase-like protein